MLSTRVFVVFARHGDGCKTRNRIDKSTYDTCRMTMTRHGVPSCASMVSMDGVILMCGANGVDWWIQNGWCGVPLSETKALSA